MPHHVLFSSQLTLRLIWCHPTTSRCVALSPLQTLRDAFLFFRIEGTEGKKPLSQSMASLFSTKSSAKGGAGSALGSAGGDGSVLEDADGGSSVPGGSAYGGIKSSLEDDAAAAASHVEVDEGGDVITNGLIDATALHALLNSVGVRVDTLKINKTLMARAKVPSGVYDGARAAPKVIAVAPADGASADGTASTALTTAVSTTASVPTHDESLGTRIATFLSRTFTRGRKGDAAADETVPNTDIRLDYEQTRDVFIALCDIRTEISRRRRLRKRGGLSSLGDGARSKKSILKRLITVEDAMVAGELAEAVREVIRARDAAPSLRAGISATLQSPIAVRATAAFGRGTLLADAPPIYAGASSLVALGESVGPGSPLPSMASLPALMGPGGSTASVGPGASTSTAGGGASGSPRGSPQGSPRGSPGKGSPGKSRNIALALAERENRRLAQARQRELHELGGKYEAALRRQVDARSEARAEASAANDDKEGSGAIKETLMAAVHLKRDEDTEVLSLSGQNLSVLPSRPWQLAKGDTSEPRPLIVDVSFNNLEVLPDAARLTAVIGRAVRKLDISHNVITTLPEGICELERLQILLGGTNRLMHLPDTLCMLSELQLLSLPANQLVRLPASFGDLTALRVLHVQGNALTTLPPSLGGCVALEDIDCSNNKLINLPDSLGGCTALRQLRASHNILVELPASIGSCSALRLMDVAYNRLRELPSSLGATCKQLRVVSASNNSLRYLPASFTGLRSLLEMDFSHNVIRAIDPAVFLKCRSLQRLNLSFNKLEALPATIGHCVLLQEALLSHNELRTIPPEIAACKYLIRLNARCNKLGALDSHGPDMRIGAKVKLLEDGDMRSPKAAYMSAKEMMAQASRASDQAERARRRASLVASGLMTTDEAAEEEEADEEAEETALRSAGSFPPAGTRRGQALPSTVGVMPSLEWVDVSHNEATRLTPELGLCPRLMHVNASHNRIRRLEPLLCKSRTLRTLVVCNNRLVSISNVAGFFMHTLEALDVSVNLLERLPDSLGLCVSLRHLMASGNRLLNVPATFGRLMHVIVTLDVQHNPLLEMPAALPWQSTDFRGGNPDGPHGDFVEENFTELRRHFPFDILPAKGAKGPGPSGGLGGEGSVSSAGMSSHMASVADSVAYQNAVPGRATQAVAFPDTQTSTLALLLERAGARLASDSAVVSLQDYTAYVKGMLSVVRSATARVAARAASRGGGAAGAEPGEMADGYGPDGDGVSAGAHDHTGGGAGGSPRGSPRPRTAEMDPRAATALVQARAAAAVMSRADDDRVRAARERNEMRESLAALAPQSTAGATRRGGDGGDGEDTGADAGGGGGDGNEGHDGDEFFVDYEAAFETPLQVPGHERDEGGAARAAARRAASEAALVGSGTAGPSSSVIGGDAAGGSVYHDLVVVPGHARGGAGAPSGPVHGHGHGHGHAGDAGAAHSHSLASLGGVQASAMSSVTDTDPYGFHGAAGMRELSGAAIARAGRSPAKYRDGAIVPLPLASASALADSSAAVQQVSRGARGFGGTIAPGFGISSYGGSIASSGSGVSSGDGGSYVPLHGLARGEYNALQAPSLLSLDTASSGSVSVHSVHSSLPPSEVTLARWQGALRLSESYSRERSGAWQSQGRAEEVLMKLARLAPSLGALADALRSTSVLRLLVRARVDAALDQVETAEEAAARQAAARVTASKLDAAGSAWRADAFDEFEELKRLDAEKVSRTKSQRAMALGLGGPGAAGDAETAIVRHTSREFPGITDGSAYAMVRSPDPGKVSTGYAYVHGDARGPLRHHGGAGGPQVGTTGVRVGLDGASTGALHSHADGPMDGVVPLRGPGSAGGGAGGVSFREALQSDRFGAGPNDGVSPFPFELEEGGSVRGGGVTTTSAVAVIPAGPTSGLRARLAEAAPAFDGSASAAARHDIITDMLHGLVGGPHSSPSRGSTAALRWGNTQMDAHPQGKGRTNHRLGPGASLASASHSMIAGSIADLPSGSAVPSRRITVGDLQKQLARSHEGRGGTGRTPRSFSNADVAQYAVLVSIFVPYAEEEWVHRGGLYLLGKAGAHEFVAAVVHRLVADYYFGIRATALPAMLTSAALHARPSKLEKVGRSGSPTGGSGSMHMRSDETLPSGGSYVAGFGAVPGRAAAAAAAGFAPGASGLSAAGSAVDAFDSLPALLGDEWNEALLRCIYHYYVRAHTAGTVPLFGELAPEEARWRREQAIAVRDFRSACKALGDASREASAKANLAMSRKFVDIRDRTEMDSVKAAAREAGARLDAAKAAAEARQRQAAKREAEYLKSVVARRHLAQVSRRADKERIDAEKWSAEADVLKYRTVEGVKAGDAAARAEAESAGLNPKAYHAHVRRALYAAGLAAAGMQAAEAARAADRAPPPGTGGWV